MRNKIKKESRVAFDIGCVLCHVYVNEFLDFLVEKGMFSSFNESEEFLAGIQFAQDLGLYNIRQGFYRFKPDISKHLLEEMYNKWMNIVLPSLPMLKLLEDLVESKVQVALLSNIGYDHAKVVRRKYPIFKQCIQHFSCEVGARKPSKLFFQSFMLQHNWPTDTLFFDDRPENIKGAQGILQGVLFDMEEYPSDVEAATSLRVMLSKNFSI